jgi:type VI secretion system protein ImpM
MATPLPLVDARDAPGWYGKLASLGDFAHRRLPPQWLNACEAWLPGAMRGAREHLGERWLDTYLTAPVLRFGWAPGVVDAQWWFGLLMPSCDSVGRYYPLLIAQPRAHPPQDRIALDHLERWYEHLAQAAMHTLNEAGGSIETLEAALQDAPSWPTPGRGPALDSRADVRGEQHRLARSAPLAHWMHALAAQQLAARLAGCSAWWRVPALDAGASLDVVKGLPDGAAFAALLAGSASANR